MEKYRADYTNTFRALTLDKLRDTALFNSDEFVAWNERWQAKLGRQEESKEASQQLMNDSNPVVIPRNHLGEEALEAAVERGYYSVMEKLLEVLSSPFEHLSEKTDYCLVPGDSSGSYRTFCIT